MPKEMTLNNRAGPVWKGVVLLNYGKKEIQTHVRQSF